MVSTSSCGFDSMSSNLILLIFIESYNWLLPQIANLQIPVRIRFRPSLIYKKNHLFYKNLFVFSVAERLQRQTVNLLYYYIVGSNPTTSSIFLCYSNTTFYLLFVSLNRVQLSWQSESLKSFRSLVRVQSPPKNFNFIYQLMG